MGLDNKSLSLNAKNATVIGGGVIGSSWIALFLANGMRVTVSDPMEGIEKSVKEYVVLALKELSDMGVSCKKINNDNIDSYLFFEKDTAKAVASADIVQENGPEREDFKSSLWQLIEKNVPEHTLLLSSSSGITATKQSVKMNKPERLIIGHPFNPPHLMPLVEVVPGVSQKSDLIDQVLEFYGSLGKFAVLLKKEIPGFVANRVQAAVTRECLYLVREGVASADEIDKIITTSLGIRWATSGPFLSHHLGGGVGGIKHFLEQFAPSTEAMWHQQVKNIVCYDEKTKEVLTEQVLQGYGNITIEELETLRDKREIAIIKALNGLKF
ncbi:hydroxylacyl-CoA dehydrogenase [Serratia marcescens]|nr:hydroxylacyl-CoA dehydrogenase [Serratia marcescens]